MNTMRTISTWALTVPAAALTPAAAAAHGGHAAAHGTVIATMHHMGLGSVLFALAVLAIGGVAARLLGRLTRRRLVSGRSCP